VNDYLNFILFTQTYHT